MNRQTALSCLFAVTAFGTFPLGLRSDGAPMQPRVTVLQVIGDSEDRPRGFGRWLTGREPERLFERPFAVAWVGDDLLVADPPLRRVVRIDGRGRLRARTPDDLLASPMGLAVCAGRILVTDSQLGSVIALGDDLRPQAALATGLRRPTGIVCGDGQVFVVETAAHRVLILGSDGSVRGAVGERGDQPGRFNYPVAIARDDEFLLVGDTLNFRIQRLEAGSGQALDEFGSLGDSAGETPRIKGIAIDSAGRRWVSDAFLDQVALFDRAGRFLGELGGRGQQEGQFSFPAGIAVHADGRIAIADSLNRRIQIVRLDAPAIPSRSGEDR